MTRTSWSSLIARSLTASTFKRLLLQVAELVVQDLGVFIKTYWDCFFLNSEVNILSQHYHFGFSSKMSFAY